MRAHRTAIAARRRGTGPPASKYVSPNGNDTSGDGSLSTPWRTLGKALSTVAPGSTVYMRGPTGPVVKYASETFSSAHSGTSTDPKIVRNYPNETPIIQGITQFSTGTSRAQYIHFVGDPAFQTNRSASTIRFENATNSQHVIEFYGDGNVLDGCDIDHLSGYLGSCVAMGWNGQAGQWRAVDCKVINCTIRGIGTDPGLGTNDAGHDHGVYINYALNCEVSYNVFENINGGWFVHMYTETASGRHVDGTWVHHNTGINSRDGGIICAGQGTDVTKNTLVEYNLLVNAGNPALTKASYSLDEYWGGGTVGTNNIGSNNHSYNPADGDARPGMTGFTISATTGGDPLFLNLGLFDYHLAAATPASGKGAFPTPDTSGAAIGNESNYTSTPGDFAPAGLVPGA